MLEIESESFAGRPDKRAIQRLERYRKFQFDPAFIADLKNCHGGIPKTQYFTTPQGNQYRIGRFLTTFDSKSKLNSPEQPYWEFPEFDAREQRSISTVIDQEGPSCRAIFSGERVIPFAALYRGEGHPDGYSLTECDCKLVCFDNQQTPLPTIAVWDGHDAHDEYMRWEQGGSPEPNYDLFLEPVARSYEEFVAMLTLEPR